jgi:hypothetical protein
MGINKLYCSTCHSGTTSEVGFSLIQQTGEEYNESKREKLNLIESECIEKLRGI